MLPQGVTVFERGWLSANNVLLKSDGHATLIDSGYFTHASQTCALVAQALGGEPLDLLINTHLHSDHCGGNSALQSRFPSLQTLIPPGHAAAARQWNDDILSFNATGQTCPRFHFEGTLQPGVELRLGGYRWEVHAAPGHDPHSVLLFAPAISTLISADALWERGFGVVFPELEGMDAFDEVERTLDLIATLSPRIVIPGHGRVFTDVQGALSEARRRLHGFQQSADKHARYAAKVLLKFRLLEAQRIPTAELARWAFQVPYLLLAYQRHAPGQSFERWLSSLLGELLTSGALLLEGEEFVNA